MVRANARQSCAERRRTEWQQVGELQSDLPAVQQLLDEIAAEKKCLNLVHSPANIKITKHYFKQIRLS